MYQVQAWEKRRVWVSHWTQRRNAEEHAATAKSRHPMVDTVVIIDLAKRKGGKDV